MQQTTQHQQRNNPTHDIGYCNMYPYTIHCSIKKKPRVYLPARNTTEEYGNVIEYECRDSE